MLKAIIGIIVQRFLEWVYAKLSDWHHYKKTIQKQREKIEEMKRRLEVAETELDRREATKNLADNFPN